MTTGVSATAGRPALPGTTREGHYVYVVEFNSGTIKVGRTANPASRLKSLATAGRPHGIAVASQWLSQPHGPAKQNEARLIDFCNAHYTPLNDGEFFGDASAEDVVAFGETLSAGTGERLRFNRFGRIAGREGWCLPTDPVVVVALPLDLVAQIDAVRGGATRDQWLRDLARHELESKSITLSTDAKSA